MGSEILRNMASLGKAKFVGLVHEYQAVYSEECSAAWVTKNLPNN